MILLGPIYFRPSDAFPRHGDAIGMSIQAYCLDYWAERSLMCAGVYLTVEEYEYD